MKRKITIKDVAAHCGYSFKTVARVVNEAPTVDPAIRERVRASIDALGYEPNVVARTLRGSRSFTIGLVYEQPVAEVQKGVLAACQRLGYGLQIVPLEHKRTGLGQQLAETATRARLAGLILVPPVSEMADVIATLRQHRVAFAVMASGAEPTLRDMPCVHVDDRQAAYDVTNHLLAQGHRAIGFIWGDAKHGSSKARYAGYAAAIKDHKLQVKPSWVVKGRYDFESGMRGALQLLRGAYRPTAIVSSNDEMAAGALMAARVRGLDVPVDVAIAGFEDSHFSQQAWPPITTARQPTEQMAECAVELLVSLLRARQNGSQTSLLNLARGFRPELIVRDSTLPRARNRRR